MNKYIFQGVIIDEPTCFEEVLSYVVAHRFGACPIALYDLAWLFVLYLVGVDKFKIRDF